MDAVAEAVQRYDELLRGLDPGGVHARIQERARALNVTYRDRVACQVLRPLFIGRPHYDAILERSRLIVEALHRADALVRQTPSLAEYLRLTAVDASLIAIDGGYDRDDVIGRLDSFLDARGVPVFLEYNAESPGGIAYGDRLGQVFDELEPLRRLAETTPLSRRPVVPSVVAAFAETYREWSAARGSTPREAPQVAIVDFADIPTIGEFEFFRGSFEAAGMPAQIVTPESLSLENGELRAGDFRVDILYRRLITPDLLARLSPDHLLVEAARGNVCCVGNGLGGHLLSHKGLFALLFDADRRPTGLTPEHLAAIEGSLPWTAMACDDLVLGPGTSPGTPEPLADLVVREQSRLVLKPGLGYGGVGVHLGWTMTPEDWRERWRESLGTCTVVQERVSIPRADYPAWEGDRLVWHRLQYDIDPYVLRGREIHGLGIRLSDGELLNVASGAGSAVPAYIVG